jgi:hypothetical protein
MDVLKRRGAVYNTQMEGCNMAVLVQNGGEPKTDPQGGHLSAGGRIRWFALPLIYPAMSRREPRWAKGEGRRTKRCATGRELHRIVAVSLDKLVASLRCQAWCSRDRFQVPSGGVGGRRNGQGAQNKQHMQRCHRPWRRSTQSLNEANDIGSRAGARASNLQT